MKTLKDVKVGDTVWVDSRYHAPLPKMVTGETRTSWIVGERYNAVKVPKKLEGDEQRLWTRPDRHSGSRHRVYLSEEEIADNIWIEKHKDRIANFVRFCASSESLRQIAAMVGYKENN
jgi:hypothetical protein